MFFAELHGKLSRNYSRVHERAEDLLTSTAFQLLRYIPADRGLFPALRRTRRVRFHDHQLVVDRQPPGWLTEPLARADGYEFEFWPGWGAGTGQPELVLTLLAASQRLGRLVVEVKLDSGKSQIEDSEEDCGKSAEPHYPDQLARYWRRLVQGTVPDGVPALGVVYLTAHALPPLEALQESLSQQPGDWLGWLSWRDVWAVAKGAAADHLPARDLADILGHKGLKHFDGFRPPDRPLPPNPAGFWRTRWFAPPAWRGSVAAKQGFWASPEGTK